MGAFKKFFDDWKIASTGRRAETGLAARWAKRKELFGTAERAPDSLGANEEPSAYNIADCPLHRWWQESSVTRS
jgi:hypothetical protein